ncbi:hypothetical protein ACJJTC_003549 [Scirpophaga incertulas]
MSLSPNKQYHSNPDLMIAANKDDSTNIVRKRRRSEEDISQAIERLEKSFTIKIGSVITELQSQLTSINCTIKSELSNLTTVTSEIKSDINELRSERTEFRVNIEDLNNKHRMLESEVASIRDSYEFQFMDQADIKKSLENLKSQTSNDIPDKVIALQDKINSMEQLARQNNLEICNLPEKRGENLITIIESIGKAIKCQLDQTGVIKTYVNLIILYHGTVAAHKVTVARRSAFEKNAHLNKKVATKPWPIAIALYSTPQAIIALGLSLFFIYSVL